MEMTKEIVKPMALKKHVNAIHCTNSLTLIQRKITNVFLYNAYHDLTVKNFFSISLKKLCKLIDYNSRNYKLLIDALYGLATLKLEWGILTPAKGLNDISWGICSMLSSIEISNGICTYEYSNRIKQFLYQPLVYGLIDLKIQAKFRSSYGLALYETCCRFQDIPQTKWIEIDELRKLMGVSVNQYPRYSDFRRRIVNVALAEVNDKSGFKVDIEEKLFKRNVSHVRFFVDRGDQPQPIALVQNISTDQHVEIITTLTTYFGLKEEVARSIVANYSRENILAKIDIIKNSISYKQGNIKNLAGALVTAIKNDYESPIASKNVIAQKHHDNAKRDHDRLQKQREEGRLNEAYQGYISDKVKDYLQLLSDPIRTALYNDFISFCEQSKNIIALQKARRGDFESPLVKPVFNKFISDHYLKGRVMNKEQFIKVL